MLIVFGECVRFESIWYSFLIVFKVYFKCMIVNKSSKNVIYGENILMKNEFNCLNKLSV